MKRNVLKYSLIMCLFCVLTSFEATYYGRSVQGNLTASGERFDMNALTCASNHFKIGSRLLVMNIENKKKVIVRVNDRGGMPDNVVDLTEKAFSKIAELKRGRIKVKITLLKQNEN